MADGFELAVRGGTVVTATGRRRLDVYVRDGRVSALLPPGEGEPAAEVVDATGCFVLPGFVDTHVHLMDPGDDTREDFPSGTAAAAASGVTTIIEHTHGWPVTGVDRLTEKRAHLQGRSHVDFALAAHIWPGHLHELPGLWRAGIAFFKAFTCETHGVPAVTAERLLEVFEQLAELDATALVHCEDDLITAANERRLRATGRLDGGIVPEWRSREAELVATGSAALLSRVTGARVNVAHVSGTAPLDLVHRERQQGADIAAETCPQYLTLREEEILDEGPLRKFTPPARLRSQAEEDRLWEAFDRGAFTLLSSDHAPSTRAQKADGNIWDVHFGLPGLDTTSSVLLDAALTGRTSLERVVEAYSTVPARRYRLAGKGRLTPGADADLVVVDPAATRRVEAAGLHSKAGWSPFEGRVFRGRVAVTILRGAVVARDGQPGPTRDGRFLPGPGRTAGGRDDG